MKTAQTKRAAAQRTAKDFTVSFTVAQTPDEAFAAINDVRGWWSEEIVGGTAKLGDVFTFRYGDLHVSKQRITESIPGKRVVWHVVEARLSFTKDAAEWTGTDIVFDLAKKGKKTEVRFTHVGLAPANECYEDCSKAWGFYVTESLQQLITTGTGKPTKKGEGD